MSFLQRYLLITAAVTVLASLSSPMPLSWSNSLRHRRSRPGAPESPTLPTDAGKVHQNPLEPSTGAGGETNTSRNTSACPNGTMQHSSPDCMSECYSVPLERINDVKRFMKDENKYIHPHFLLGEYLENLHREEFCNSVNTDVENILCEDEQSPQLINDIVAKVSNYSDYLNSHGTQSSCSSTYKVSYHADRYPRYLVQVQCSNPNDRITIGKMLYLQYEDSTWITKEHNDVAIGCRCGSSC